MPLTGPVLKLTAGAVAGLLSVGTGAVVRHHGSAGAGTRSAHSDASVDAAGANAAASTDGAGAPDGVVVDPVTGAVISAKGGKGGGQASAGANAKPASGAGMSLPKVDTKTPSPKLDVPNPKLGGSNGAPTGSGTGRGGSSTGPGGSGQPSVGSLSPLYAKGDYTVVVPPTQRVSKKLCLAATGAGEHCQTVTVESVNGATLALAYAGNASAQPPEFSVKECTGGLRVAVDGLTPGASLIAKLDGKELLSAPVTAEGYGGAASLCDA